MLASVNVEKYNKYDVVTSATYHLIYFEICLELHEGGGSNGRQSGPKARELGLGRGSESLDSVRKRR